MPNNKEKLQRRKEISLLLKEKLIEALDIPYEPRDISEDIALIGSGLGLDSLDVLEIVLCVENNFGVKIPEGQTLALRSLNTLIDFRIRNERTCPEKILGGARRKIRRTRRGAMRGVVC